MGTLTKNPAAVVLGRQGGKKGGPARAAALTPEERSQIARRAVQARWAKSKGSLPEPAAGTAIKQAAPKGRGKTKPSSASDQALLALLHRLKTATAQSEVLDLSTQIERLIFHKQFHPEQKQ